MYPMKIAIVGDGALHIQPKENYRRQAEAYAQILNHEKTKGQHGEEEVRKFDAIAVDSAEEALEGHLRTINNSRMLVFISNRFMREAKDLAEKYQRSNLRVVLITGLLPDDAPILLPKSVGIETLCDILHALR